MKHKWYGITYLEFLRYGGLWKRLMCPVGFHLFDEVVSDTHYLVCDACELTVPLGLSKEVDDEKG